jgi:hypothetical protein
MTKQEISIFEQPLFRTIVVGGTGLTLAVMLGSLALVTGPDTGGFQWGWSWWSLVWFAGGLLFTQSFWRAVFRLQANPSQNGKTKVVYHVFALVILGVGAFLYPVQFLKHEHYFQIALGLFTSVVFLGTVVVMLFKIGQGLFANDLPDGKSS